MNIIDKFPKYRKNGNKIIILENEKTKIIINNKYLNNSKSYREILKNHHDLGKIAAVDGEVYQFIKIWKDWNWGWYYIAELKCLTNKNNPNLIFPYKNKSCCIPELIKILNINSRKLGM